VKRRRNRKAAVILSSVGTAGMATLILVAFLGRNVGTFTVSLDTGDLALSLSKKKDLSSPTSFLAVKKLDPFEEMTFTDLPKASVLDDADTDEEKSGLEVGEDGFRSRDYFKYTFYVFNAGTKVADYDLSLTLREDHASSDGRSLFDTVRVLLFDNSTEESHDYEVYAKAPTKDTRVDENGNKSEYEYVSNSPQSADSEHPFQGFAKNFLPLGQEKTGPVIRKKVSGLSDGQWHRYTFVFYQEGDDPDSSSLDTAPSGAKLKFSVEVNAYEHQEE
jgi:hypothetical protein